MPRAHEPHANLCAAALPALTLQVEIVESTSFEMRFAIVTCCTTGRNIMFAGYSIVARESCNVPREKLALSSVATAAAENPAPLLDEPDEWPDILVPPDTKADYG